MPHQQHLSSRLSTLSFQVRTGLQILEVLRTLQPNTTFRTDINFSPTNQSPSSLLMERVRHTCMVRNETLGCNFTPYLLESTPPVMSVGVKCMDEGYDFVWRAGKEPYFQKPDGVRIKLTVRDYAPYVPSKIKKFMPCKSRVHVRSSTLGFVLKLLLHRKVRLLHPRLLPLRWPYLLKSQRAQMMRGAMMMGVGEKKEKPAGRLIRPAPLTGRSSRQRMILTLVMMPWTIRYQDPWWQNADGGKPC